MNETFLQKLRRVRICDIAAFFLFLAAIVPAAFVRKRRQALWLITENGTEARDSGYYLFRYLRKEQPKVDAVYAIRPDSPEFEKVSVLGETVPYGSFRHWILYLAAEFNISTQKYGKPNAAVCYALEVTLKLLKNRRIFLQHGVIKDDLPFLHYDKARFSMFCCSARPEYEYVKSVFGYPEGVVKLTGLCRFDALHGCETDKDLILIVPTWRMPLQRQADREMFMNSDYYRAWHTLLCDGKLSALLGKYGKHAEFVMHRNMTDFEDCFSEKPENIQIVKWKDADISGWIRTAAVLLTDWSSIYMDFAYQEKPVVYYQFDEAEYRNGHLPEGYYDYHRDGFGPICVSEEEALSELEQILADGCSMSAEYRGRAEAFFEIRDTKNSERTYLAVRELDER